MLAFCSVICYTIDMGWKDKTIDQRMGELWSIWVSDPEIYDLLLKHKSPDNENSIAKWLPMDTVDRVRKAVRPFGIKVIYLGPRPVGSYQSTPALATKYSLYWK